MYEDIGTYAGYIFGYIMFGYILYKGITWLIDKSKTDAFYKETSKQRQDEKVKE